MSRKKVFSKIKDIINTNTDIAFIIGNGVHRYCSDKIENYKCVSWENLLLNLAKQNDLTEKIPSGISYTEFFDILELNKWKKQIEQHQSPKYIQESLIKNSLLAFSNTHKLLNDLNAFQKSDFFSQAKGRPINNNTDLLEKSIFAPSLKQIINSSRDKLSSYGFIDPKSIPYIGLQDFVFKIRQDQFVSNTKKYIQYKMKDWETNDIIKRIVVKIKELNSPLLTTNYDDVFSKSIKNLKLQIVKNNGAKFSDIYPWNCYYSDNRSTKYTSGFGIWHINGMVKYHRSIRIGLTDYMNCISKARQMLKGSIIFENDEENHKDKSMHWKGYNTWIHQFFNNSLFIFGLNLDENELFLRWLLIQRKKYYLTFGQKHNGWYITKDKLSEGKILFLESVGIEIIKVQDYKTLYEDIWQ